MAASEFRSYGWAYAIGGTAFVLGSAVMFYDASPSRMYLVTSIAGTIMLFRGLILLRQPQENEKSGKQNTAATTDAEDGNSTAVPTSGLTNVPTPPEPAWLKEAFSAQPLRPIEVLPTLSVIPPTTESEGAEKTAASPAQIIQQNMWNYVLPAAFFLGMLVIVVYIYPYLIYNWPMVEARGEAEAAFLIRRAELRAESEHGEERLDKLDKRMELIPLGFNAVVQKVSPMVVTVTNLAERPPDRVARPVLVYDPEHDKRYWQNSVGTGFIAKPGYILTNYHVVFGADHLRITFASGQSVFVPRTALAGDDVMDLAIIRMPAHEDMKGALEFADSDKDVQVGNWSLTIGSPLGLKHTFTHGVISAKGRLTNWLPVELLQTDAAINPGNSGGPLLDQSGRVIGVNVALASENGRNQGIGFAIPSNAARKIMETLIKHGHVSRGFMGILPVELPPERFSELGKQDLGGTLVQKVEPGTPANKAGIRDDDIIVRFNNEPLLRNESAMHLRRMIASIDPGTEVNLEILRGGQRRRINVILGKRPDHIP